MEPVERYFIMRADQSTSFAPCGTILEYSTADVPDGWIAPHGQLASQTRYPHLFKLLGHTYTPAKWWQVRRRLERRSLDKQKLFRLPNVRKWHRPAFGHSSLSTIEEK